MRAESAARTVELDFDGYGIGGLSVGEPRSEMLPALAAAVAELPADRPRYLMGVGDPVSIVEAVALGVDMFDCVLPTRLGRHGTALTSGGKVQIRGAALARDLGPIDEGCSCRTCTLHSRAYLRHLFMVGEPSGPRLVDLAQPGVAAATDGRHSRCRGRGPAGRAAGARGGRPGTSTKRSAASRLSYLPR